MVATYNFGSVFMIFICAVYDYLHFKYSFRPLYDL